MNWHSKPLGDCVEVFDSLRCPITKKDRISGPYPYYGASGIVDYVDSYIYEGLHILVAEDGENLRSRKVPIAYLANGRFWANNHAHVLTANDENDTRFLSYRIESIDLSPYITGSTQPKLSQAALLSIPLSVPPKEDQRRIASLLGALDDKIESNRHIISHSESLVIAQFHSLFTTEQAPVGTALSALMKINPRYPLKKGSLSTKVSMQDVPANSPMVDTFEVTSAGAGSRFANGDVLFARISPCLENGKTAIVDFLHEAEVGFGSTEFIVLSPQGDVSTAWIYALARDPDFRESCRQAMNGSSGRQRLSADFFSKYTIAPPHEGDLAAFNTTARPLLTLMGVRRDEKKRLTQLRDALLPELMSGRMHVNEAGRLISEALDEEVDDA